MSIRPARELAHEILRRSAVGCVVHDYGPDDIHYDECNDAVAAILADRVAVIEEARAAGREDGLLEAEMLAHGFVSASLHNPIWDACRFAIEDELRDIRNRPTNAKSAAGGGT